MCNKGQIYTSSWKRVDGIVGYILLNSQMKNE